MKKILFPIVFYWRRKEYKKSLYYGYLNFIKRSFIRFFNPILVCLTIYFVGNGIKAEISRFSDRIVVEIVSSLPEKLPSQNTNPLIDSRGWRYGISGNGFMWGNCDSGGRYLATKSSSDLSIYRPPTLSVLITGDSIASVLLRHKVETE